MEYKGEEGENKRGWRYSIQLLQCPTIRYQPDTCLQVSISQHYVNESHSLTVAQW